MLRDWRIWTAAIVICLFVFSWDGFLCRWLGLGPEVNQVEPNTQVGTDGSHVTFQDPVTKKKVTKPVYAGGAEIIPPLTPGGNPTVKIPQAGLKWKRNLARIHGGWMWSSGEWRPDIGISLLYIRRIEFGICGNDHRIGAGALWHPGNSNFGLGAGAQVAFPKIENPYQNIGFYAHLEFFPFK